MLVRVTAVSFATQLNELMDVVILTATDVFYSFRFTFIDNQCGKLKKPK